MTDKQATKEPSEAVKINQAARALYAKHPTYRGTVPLPWHDAPHAVKREWLDKAREQLPGVFVPLETIEAAIESLGSFCSDQGWGAEDMQNMDNLISIVAQHKAKGGAA